MKIKLLLAFCALFLFKNYSYAEPGKVSSNLEINISRGDVTGLIAAINAANSNGQDNTINITGTYVLTAINDITDGNNGLPSITGTVTINGGAGATIKRGHTSKIPLFRIFHVAETGSLTINGITIEGGALAESDFAREGTGAGILNLGNLTITDSVIMENFAGDESGGIDSRGRLLIASSSTITMKEESEVL